MKGSSVVQGLKSLASKLHPQLPLSPKESQRLLTALTSSFRQHLDEAHPHRAANDEARPKVSAGGSVKAHTEGLHSSSIALADKHLASVLTNPLLSKHVEPKKPVLDYATAKIFLQENPAKDPVELLEEYHEHGAATLSIATLCLDSFNRSLKKQPELARKKALAETEAGKRTLDCLWKTKLLESEEFVDSKKLIELIVRLMIYEGHENQVWQWFQMDLALGDQAAVREGEHPVKIGYRRARWKNYLLRAIVATKLDDNTPASLPDALEAFLKACRWKRQNIESRTESYVPLSAAAVMLHNILCRHPERLPLKDASLFDDFVNNCDLYSTSGFDGKHKKCELLLRHPQRPSPLPALQFLRTISEQQTSGEARHLFEVFNSPQSEQQRHSFYQLMIETAGQLQGRNLQNDANWVSAKTRQLFPEYDRFEDRHLREYRVGRKLVPERAQEDEHITVSGRLPFPSFV